jgi:hypothetical protein
VLTHEATVIGLLPLLVKPSENLPVSLIGYYTFDECAACIVVWLDSLFAHLVEEGPSFVRVTTPDAYVDERVVSDIIWGQIELSALHLVKQLESFGKTFFNRTTFDEGVEGDLVWFEERLLPKRLKQLQRCLNLVAVDARV